MQVTHPASFLVRNSNYNQNLNYGSTCCEILQKVLDKKDVSRFGDLLNALARGMCARADDLIETTGGDQSWKKMFFAVVRPKDQEGRPDCLHEYQGRIDSKYTGDVERFYDDVNSGLFNYRRDAVREYNNVWHFFYTKKDSSIIRLSKIEVKGDTALIDYVTTDISAIKQTLNELYNSAMDEQTPQESKKAAMIDIYYMMSHYAPLFRGSATLARLTLQYIAEKIGEPIPLTKKEINLNTAALLTPRGIFAERFNLGYYFDKEIMPEAVCKWQQLLIERIASAKLDQPNKS